jgi:hypothetical protein
MAKGRVIIKHQPGKPKPSSQPESNQMGWAKWMAPKSLEQAQQLGSKTNQSQEAPAMEERSDDDVQQ